MPLSPAEREELRAVADADRATMLMLPKEAHIASSQSLAERCLALDEELEQLGYELKEAREARDSARG